MTQTEKLPLSENAEARNAIETLSNLGYSADEVVRAMRFLVNLENKIEKKK